MRRCRVGLDAVWANVFATVSVLFFGALALAALVCVVTILLRWLGGT